MWRKNATKRASRSQGQQVPKPSGTMSVLQDRGDAQRNNNQIPLTSWTNVFFFLFLALTIVGMHEKIPRMNLADHQEMCPLEPVNCPFFEAGCTEKIARKDLTAYKASNTEHHAPGASDDRDCFT